MCFVQDAEDRLKSEMVSKQANRWCELRVVYLQGVATSTTGTRCPLTLYCLPSSQSPSWPRISQKGDTESVSVSAPAAVALAGSSEGSRLEPAAGRCEGGVGWCGRCEGGVREEWGDVGGMRWYVSQCGGGEGKNW